MNSGDSAERLLWEQRMRKMLDELSQDPVAQRSFLRLENSPTVTNDLNKNKGKVFNFSNTKKNMENRATVNVNGEMNIDTMLKRIDILYTEIRNSGPVLMTTGEQVGNIMKENTICLLNDNHHNTGMAYDEEIGSHVPILIQNTASFNIRTVEALISGTSGRNRNSKKKTMSWSKKKMLHNRQDLSTSKDLHATSDKEAEQSTKRKALEDEEVSSKISKHSACLMVHQKPSSKDI